MKKPTSAELRGRSADDLDVEMNDPSTIGYDVDPSANVSFIQPSEIPLDDDVAISATADYVSTANTLEVEIDPDLIEFYAETVRFQKQRGMAILIHICILYYII